ncbi:MAG: 6-phosphogluconolactonase [Pseudomonadota bacterium]
METTSREALDEALANYISEALQAEIQREGDASLAVSGGSTPKGVFRRLSNAPLDWSKIDITLVDERWVPPDHADSNERLARENLLRGRAAAAHFVGLKTDHADARDGLVEASEGLASIRRPLTLTILGMGGDGHTASWFPKANNLADLLDPSGQQALGACDPVTAPHQRITLTLPAVLRSREVLLHIVGTDKRRVLESAAAESLPIAHVTEQTQTPVSIWWSPDD